MRLVAAGQGLRVSWDLSIVQSYYSGISEVLNLQRIVRNICKSFLDVMNLKLYLYMKVFWIHLVLLNYR